MPIAKRIGLEEIPAEIQALSDLDRIDYADAYTATVQNARSATPEDWARASLESPFGDRARRLWERVGLRLGPSGSTDHVQGWAIEARGGQWIRLQTRSWYATLQAVCHVTESEVTLAVFLRFDQPVVGRLVWVPVGPMHRRGVPLLLRQAVARHSRVANPA